MKFLKLITLLLGLCWTVGVSAMRRLPPELQARVKMNEFVNFVNEEARAREEILTSHNRFVRYFAARSVELNQRASVSPAASASPVNVLLRNSVRQMDPRESQRLFGAISRLRRGGLDASVSQSPSSSPIGCLTEAVDVKNVADGQDPFEASLGFSSAAAASSGAAAPARSSSSESASPFSLSSRSPLGFQSMIITPDQMCSPQLPIQEQARHVVALVRKGNIWDFFAREIKPGVVLVTNISTNASVIVKRVSLTTPGSSMLDNNLIDVYGNGLGAIAVGNQSPVVGVECVVTVRDRKLLRDAQGQISPQSPSCCKWVVMEYIAGRSLREIFDVSTDHQALGGIFFEFGEFLAAMHRGKMQHIAEHPSLWSTIIASPCLESVMYDATKEVGQRFVLLNPEKSGPSTTIGSRSYSQTPFYDVLLFVCDAFFKASHQSVEKLGVCVEKFLNGYSQIFSPLHSRVEQYLKNELQRFLDAVKTVSQNCDSLTVAALKQVIDALGVSNAYSGRLKQIVNENVCKASPERMQELISMCERFKLVLSLSPND